MDNRLETRIQYIKPDKGRRIIAVSDIHGFAGYLEGVLEKAEYSGRDILVIVGDMIEKGEESLQTIRTILRLQKENGDVYATMGNSEFYQLRLFLDDSPEACGKFIGGLRWRKEVWKRSFFLDILDELGIRLEDLCEENILAVKRQIRENFEEELFFLENLPTILSMGNFIFVHGGIPTDSLEELQDTEAFLYLKRDEFLSQDVCFGKTVIVGHWPVYLYRKELLCMNPLFDDKKHIICIDGGCALSTGAQLNALLIPHAWADMKEITYTAYDDYPVMVAKKAQSAKEGTIQIRYLDSEVRLLERKNGMARAVHISSGSEFNVPEDWLYQSEGKWYCNNYGDNHLAVLEGDILSVVKETSMGRLVKKDGVQGWYCC